MGTLLTPRVGGLPNPVLDEPAATAAQAAAAQAAAWAAAAAASAAAVADVSASVVNILSNLAALKAVVPVAGASYLVLGHVTAGDGGGGVWVCDTSGDATDGVTCVAADADLSEEDSDTIARTALNGYDLGDNVAWGTVSLEIGSVTLTDKHLHGHHVAAIALQQRLDYATGVFSDIGSHISSAASSAGQSNITVKRKTITSTRRWKRVIDDPNVYHMKWWGSNATGNDGHHYLKWLITLAKARGIKTVDLDGLTVPNVGAITMHATLTLRNGKIKYRDGMMLQNYKTTPAYDKSDPEFYVQQMDTWIRPDHTPNVDQNIAFVDFEVDGNIAGNTDPIENTGNYTGGGGVANVLQNSPVWGGICLTNQNGIDFGTNSTVRLENVHVHDTGSNCLLGHGNFLWRTHRVTVGNSARNHLMYSCQGVHKDLRFYGFWWTGMTKFEHAQIDGWVVEDMADNPHFDQGGVSLFNYEGLDWSNQAGDTSHRYRRTGFILENGRVTWDHPTRGGSVLSGIGNAGIIDGLHIQTPDTEDNIGVTLFGEGGNGFQEGLQRGWKINRVTVEIRAQATGTTPFQFSLNSRFVNADISNITVYRRMNRTGYGDESHNTEHLLEVAALGSNVRTDPAWLLRRRISLSNVSLDLDDDDNLAPVLRIRDINGSDAGVVEVSIRDVSGPFVPVYTVGSSGRVDFWTLRDPSKVRVWWDHVDIRAAQYNANNWSAFLDTAESIRGFRFKRGSTVGYSETGGRFAYVAAGGETTLTIPTDLLWVPKHGGTVRITPLNATTAAALDGHRITWRNNANSRDVEYMMFPGKSVRTPDFSWTQSASGTNEYYVRTAAGGNPNLDEVFLAAINGVNAAKGTLGSLAAGEWGWGDNDSLGYNTLYVRLSDGADPDSKALDYVRAQCWIDCMAPQLRINLAAALSANDFIHFDWSATVTR